MKQEKQKEASVKDDVLFLVVKIFIFVGLLAILFLFIFGICRCSDDMMSPAFKDGDLAVFYRLQKEFQPSDTIVIEKDGETQVRRIIAKAGDEVDLTAVISLSVCSLLVQAFSTLTFVLPLIK